MGVLEEPIKERVSKQIQVYKGDDTGGVCFSNKRFYWFY